MTGKEVMTLLKISRPILYSLIEEGRLTPTNLPDADSLQTRPRRFLFNRADVERVLREGRTRKTRHTTDYAVTLHTPPAVAAVERLFVDAPGKYEAA